MTLKPVRKAQGFTPPAEMVGEDEATLTTVTDPATGVTLHVETYEGERAVNIPVSAIYDPDFIAEMTAPAPPHDWIAYFGTDTAFGPDLYPLQPDAKLFVVTGEFTKLNPARMTVGELIDAKNELVAPVWYRVA